MSLQDEKARLIEAFTKKRIQVFFLSTLFTILMIALFGGIGYWLDQRWDTYPKIFIAWIILSYPTTQACLYLLYKKAKKRSR